MYPSKDNSVSGGEGGGVQIYSPLNFRKIGGIIYGSDAIEANKNQVMNSSGIVSNKGAAVFYQNGNIQPNPNNKRRETTLGENDNISTDDLNTGWGL